MVTFKKIGIIITAVLASITIYGGLIVPAASNPIVEQNTKQTLKQVKLDPAATSHKVMVDMLEHYIETYQEKTVSRAKLLKYVKWVDQYIEGSNMDSVWIMAMMWQESRLLEDSTSSHGAIGLLQILPSTAKSFGISGSDLYKPEVNIKTGIEYMEYLLEKYDGNLRTATIAYNQGEGNVDKGKARPWYYNQVKKHHNTMVQMLKKINKER
ncbi:Transglycosylase SLT domain-containing protein [Paenibacillus sp. ov031]|uniref:lytic transglycosylase domain-containing protein n=1 Tax=Paenibacillus sp. ov031 TaxID=1761879 RepID=UPI000921B8ED|nr:lytic transglycosylase domain-containing protein [Paenibacillus sp. ov031]SHN81830.1 Transglycosylase SLT domain-containing protein [Paenibacillus sp. ov031]